MGALKYGMMAAAVMLAGAMAPAGAAPAWAPAAPAQDPAVVRVQGVVRCQLGNGQVVMLPPGDCTARGGRIVR